MSFDSDYCSGASPGANPLWGHKRHETVDIRHVTCVSYHSSSSPSSFILVIVIAIVVVIIIIIITITSSSSPSLHHHHHHFIIITIIIISLVYYRLVSSLLLSFRPRSRLVFYPCASAASFFEAKLVLQSLRSGNLFLGTCSWKLLGNLFPGTLLESLFLGTRFPGNKPGNLGTDSWEPGTWECGNLVTGSWEPGTSGIWESEPERGNRSGILAAPTCSGPLYYG